jgi:hypothetical protein
MRLVDPGPMEFVEADDHSLYFKGQVCVQGINQR